MHVHDALTTRRTVHHYRLDQVPTEVIRRAVAAAILAPNHRMTQPWRFVQLSRSARDPLVDRSVELRSGGDRPPATPEVVERIRGKITGPPHCMVVACLRCDDDFRMGEDRAAVACAIHNLSLSLHADGVASKWSTGAITRDAAAYAAAGLDPDEVEIMGFVWIGYAEVVPEPPARKSIDEVFSER